MKGVRIVAVYGVVHKKAREIALAVNKSMQSGERYILRKLEDKVL
jgi:hypothetical protein